MRSSPKAKAVTIFTTRIFAVAAILVLAAIAAMAQATTGSLRGTVTDAAGSVVAGATVSVKSQSTGGTTSATTNSEGTFEATFLQPGDYSVTVEATGFKRAVSTGVQVKIGVVNPVAIILEPGTVAETVTVTANTEEVVQRDQAQISTTIDSRHIQDLPSNGAGGGIDTLALLAPGVIANRAGGTNTNGTGLSVNGNRGRSNNFQIDGTDNNDLSVAGPALFVDFQDAIGEFQVITNNFSAQYGRNQGAIVNIVTKGGTNTYHGTGFWFHQDNKNLNSLNNQEKASGQLEPNQSLYNVFGGTFGGPIPIPQFGEGGPSVKSGKDKLFGFGAWQGIRNPSTTTGSSTNLSVVASEFPRLLTTFPGNNVISTIATYSPFAIPGATPNTFVTGTGVQALINTNAPNLVPGCPRAIAAGSAPPTGTGGVPCPGYANLGPFLIGGPYDVLNFGTAAAPLLFQGAQYQRNQPTAYRENYLALRFDVKPSNQDSITLRYLKQTSASQNALATPATGFNGDVPAGSKNMGVSWTRQIGNTMVNEARASFNKINVEFGGGCTTGTPGCIPGPAEIGVALTNITFPVALGLTKGNALATIGPATNLPQGRIGKVWQYADNLSWTKGRHSLLFGAEYKHLTELSPFLPNYNGAYSFTSQARIVNNAPATVAITGGDPLLLFPENDQYYFIQDDFKFRSNLTLNLGIRYEYTGQPINALHDQSLIRENGPNGFYVKSLPISVRTVPETPVDKNNWAPRVGFAYSPKFWKTFLGEDATVIRGGFSIAYDASYYNILSNVQNAAPFSAALNLPASSLASTTTSPAPLPNNPTGDRVRAAATASGVLPLGQLNPIFLTQTVVAKDYHSPYSEQFSLGVQHQFGRKHVGEVRYVGTHGIGLFQNVNSNFFVGPLVNGFTRNVLVPDGPDAGTDPDTLAVVFPSFASQLPPGTVSQVCVNDATTPFIDESACNNRQFRQAGVTTRANTAQSIYHSLQARYNGRFMADALSVGASYTWSKTIDDASEIFAFTGGDITSPSAQNPFCINRCERGNSGLDRPHAFAGNFIYDVPYFREQRGVVGHVLGGWQLNGTYIVTSGGVFTPGQTSNGTLGLGNTYLTAGDRPFLTNATADRRQVGISQVDAFLLGRIGQVTNVNGFISLTALNATGATVAVTPNDVKYIFNGPGAARIFGTPFGSAGRGIERGPMFNQLNLGVFKNVKVWERLQLQLRGEAFNVLNHPQPGIGSTVTPGTTHLPSINVNNAGVAGNAFGETANQTFARRVVQVGLRVIF
ncbi:MAG TPA: carboxypeptidase regulatory-like domain-containing protein [Pyrinomonadaceae bacterium]|nr:carboxypeptidase regulatory-like domain-containing protein [Pyrinomonadaceae bacterium]